VAQLSVGALVRRLHQLFLQDPDGLIIELNFPSKG
jgi:hypothetical protein